MNGPMKNKTLLTDGGNTHAHRTVHLEVVGAGERDRPRSHRLASRQAEPQRHVSIRVRRGRRTPRPSGQNWKWDAPSWCWSRSPGLALSSSPAHWMALLGLCAGLHLISITWAADIALGGTESFRRSASPRLTIHEWGTFTALQDEQGRAISGINTDDQPLPDFVHRLAQYLMIPATELAPAFFKGAPQCHPDVTMRLETPVVYFYPPAGAPLPMKLTIQASFREGWLTEYYPNAAADAPGVRENSFTFGPLNPSVRGRLEWKDLLVGREPSFRETTSAVWLAPREVNAAGVAATYPALAAAESERYLFYRGVAHLDAPLRVVRTPSDGQLTIRAQIDERLGLKGPLTMSALWLVDVRMDGAVAFRSFPPVSLAGGATRVLATAPGQFKDAEFSKPNFENLMAAMQTALVRDGLFEDEAKALLNTWQQAYFKSPGMRLFFLVPREWTDSVLSLDTSVPSDISRTMVGRIELVSPDHRRLLETLVSSSPSSKTWLNDVGSEAWGPLMRAETTLAALGFVAPPDYQAYLDLGRFRNALILDAQTQQPSIRLGAFIQQYGLAYFKPSGS